MRRLWKAAGVAAALALALAGCTEPPKDGSDGGNGGGGGNNGGGAGSGQSTLAKVKERGKLICGVNNTVPGFGFVTEGGEYTGFDIDYCKAVAAAVLGDPTKVEYKPLTTEQRFTALQSGEIDVLIRNTTATASRDGTEGATFLTTTFYDGVRMMVRADSKFKQLKDMNNTTVCVLSGTTTEQVLASAFDELGLEYEPLSFKSNELVQKAFQSNRCEGWISDTSQLAGVRSAWPKSQGGPKALRIIGDPLSKEPLGPAVRDGDSQWASVVDWTVQATIAAEEFGITSENVEQMASSSKDPQVQQLLGVSEEGNPFDPGLGLEPDFAVDVIKAVGNYGEIYDRNLGPDTPLGLERGLNALWTEGGLMYAWPYR